MGCSGAGVGTGAGTGTGDWEGVALTGADGASVGGLTCSLSTGLGWSWGLAGEGGLMGTLAGDCS